MTQNRRPGFRLPWTSDEDEPRDAGSTAPAEPPATPETTAPAEASAVEGASNGSAPATAEPSTAGDAPGAPAPSEATPSTAGEASDATPETETSVQADVPQPAAESATAAPAEGPTEGQTAATDAAPATTQPAAAPVASTEAGPESDFLRDLVAAMRGVADEARRTTVADVQARAEARVRELETDADRRRSELQARADADVAGVGEWAKAEAERIRLEAEQRVAARRAQLEEQLAAESHRGEAETRAVRDRLAEYERELEAYHAQLAEISDPAAFAAAAKRMPVPPTFTSDAVASASVPPAATTEADPAPIPAAMAELLPPTEQNGTAPASEPASHDTLAQRLAHLRAEAAAAPAATGGAAEAETTSTPAATATAAAPASGGSVTTEVVVRGLGSFGAITGFRQALSGVDGIDGVSLSLGQSGEFVFRAAHAPGFDVAAAIVGLEGEGAKVEPTPTGGLHVTLERAR